MSDFLIFYNVNIAYIFFKTQYFLHPSVWDKSLDALDFLEILESLERNYVTFNLYPSYDSMYSREAQRGS